MTNVYVPAHGRKLTSLFTSLVLFLLFSIETLIKVIKRGLPVNVPFPNREGLRRYKYFHPPPQHFFFFPFPHIPLQTQVPRKSSNVSSRLTCREPVEHLEYSPAANAAECLEQTHLPRERAHRRTFRLSNPSLFHRENFCIPTWSLLYLAGTPRHCVSSGLHCPR